MPRRDDYDYDDDDDDNNDERYSRRPRNNNYRDDRRRDDDDDDYEDYDDYDRRPLEPHRGTLILILGIVAITGTCLLCAPVAWIMGSADLAKMRAGTMDYSGHGATQAGYVLGIIGSLLILLAIAFLCVIFAVIPRRG